MLMLMLMYIIFAIFAILFVLNARHLIKPLKKIDKKTWLILIAILLFFFVIYWFFVPNVHRVYDDEPFILARSLNYEIHISTYMAIQAIYHLVFKIFGLNNLIAIKVNILISIVNLFLLFYLMHILFKNNIISLASPIFLGIQLSYIAAATSSYKMIFALMFLLLSSIIFWLFLKYENIELNIFFVVTFLIVSLLRFELAISIIPVVLWWILVKKNRINLEKQNVVYWVKNLLIWALVFPLFIFTIFIHLVQETKGVWEHDGKIFGFQNIPINVLDMFITNDGFIRFSYISTILFLVCLFLSMYFLFKKRKLIEGTFLLSNCLIFFIFYTMTPSSIPLWYLIPIYAFLSYIFAVPLSILLRKKFHFRVVIYLILLVMILGSLKSSIASVTLHTTNFAHLSTVTPKIIEKEIPPGCIVITQLGYNLKMGANINAINSREIIRNEEILSQQNCSYFFEDYRCIIGMVKSDQAECNYFKENFLLEPKVIIRSEKANLSYTLYRVNEKNISPERYSNKKIKIIDVD